MGYSREAKCLDCGNTFTVSRGGGFFFHLLRCRKCGKTKTVGFDEIEEIHNRYLKGLSRPYSVATSGHDEEVRKDKDIEPVSKKEYNREIERFAGNCECGGKYAFNAPVRCAKCFSRNFEELDHVITCYD